MEALARDMVRLMVGVVAETAAVSFVGIRFARTKLSERLKRKQTAALATTIQDGAVSAVNVEAKWRRIESATRRPSETEDRDAGESSQARRPVKQARDEGRGVEVTLMKVLCAVLLILGALWSSVYVYDLSLMQHGRAGAVVATAVQGLFVVPSITLAVMWLTGNRGRRPGGGGGRRGPRDPGGGRAGTIEGKVIAFPGTRTG